jgi:hypothetical protein
LNGLISMEENFNRYNTNNITGILPGIMTLTLSVLNLTLNQINKETSFLLKQVNELS